MSLREGTRLTLNGVVCRVDQLLGRGAITDVYLVTPEGLPEQVALRILSSDHAINSQEASALWHEVEVLEKLNQLEDAGWPSSTAGFGARLAQARRTRRRRGVIALLASGNTADGRPYHLQELAPPPYFPTPASDLASERRIFAVFVGLARVMALAHSANYTLRDFDPARDKTNRVRVAWNSTTDDLDHLKIIDWNVTGDRSLQGRDVLYLGGHLYYALFQHHPSGGVLPAEGLAAVPGAVQISLGSRQLLDRLLRVQNRRPLRAAEVLTDAIWWHKALETALSTPSYLEQLSKVEAGRPERQRALSDLQARLSGRLAYTLVEEALDRRRSVLLELDSGKLLLRDGRHEAAAREFERVLTTATDPELARQAWVFARMAQLSVNLLAAGLEAEVPAVEGARQLLLDGRLSEASDVLAPLAAGGQTATQLIERLSLPGRVARDLASTDGMIDAFKQALPVDLASLARYEGSDADVLDGLAKALITPVHLDSILLPGEPDHGLYTLAANQQRHADELLERIDAHRRAAAALRQANACLAALSAFSDESATLDQYAQADALLTDVLAPQAWFAESLRRQVERFAAEVEASGAVARAHAAILATLPDLLVAGDYEVAFERAGHVKTAFPAWSSAEVWFALATQARALQQQAVTLLSAARANLSDLHLDEAYGALARLLDLDGTPLELPQGAVQPAPPFLLRERPSVLALRALADQLMTLLDQAMRQRAALDYNDLSATLDTIASALADTGLAPGAAFEALRVETNAALQRLERARTAFDAAAAGLPIRDWLPDAARALAGDSSREARALLEELARRVAQRLVVAPDLQGTLDEAQQALDLLQITGQTAELTELHATLARAARLDDDLRRQAPAWLAEPQWSQRLRELDDELRAMKVVRGFRSVELRCDGWEARLGELVERKADLLRVETRDLVLGGRLPAALELIHDSEAALSPGLRDRSGSAWEKLHAFAADGERLIAADRELGQLVEAVSSEQQKLEEATVLAAQVLIPDRADLPAAPLMRLRTLLAQVAALQPPQPDQGAFAEQLEACQNGQRWALQIDNELSALPHGEHLRRALAHRIGAFTRRERELIQQACARLTAYDPLSGADPGETITLYTLLFGRLAPASGNPDDPVGQALATMDRRIEQLADEARTSSEHLLSDEQRARLLLELELLERLVPISQRPDRHQLTIQWRKAVQALEPATATEGPRSLSRSLAELQRYERNLDDLAKEIWPNRFAAPLAPDTALAELRRAIATTRARAKQIEDATHLLRTELSAGETLNILGRLESLQGTELSERTRWLLWGHAQLLDDELERRKGQAQTQLGRLIDATFGENLSLMVAQLAELFEQAGSAGSLHDLIVEGIGRRERAAQPGGEEVVAAVRRLHWTAVAQAAARWANADTPIGQLHRDATEQLAALAQPGPTQPAPTPSEGRTAAASAEAIADAWARGTRAQVRWLLGALLLLLIAVAFLVAPLLGPQLATRPAPASTSQAQPGDEGLSTTVMSQLGVIERSLGDLGTSLERQTNLLETFLAATPTVALVPTGTPTMAPVAIPATASTTQQLTTQRVVALPIYSQAEDRPGNYISSVQINPPLYLCDTVPTGGRLPISQDSECSTPSGWIPADVIFEGPTP